MTREEALVSLKNEVKNKNLLKHMYACEAVMKALARHFDEDEDAWGLAGLLHDIDYEKTADGDFKNHGKIGADMLRNLGFSEEIAHAVAAHNPATGVTQDSLMDKCLYSSDPVTGLIVAAALIRPGKRLDTLDVESVIKRFHEKSFARGANREQIETCSDFGMELKTFLDICLKAMQDIHDDLGL